MIKDKELGTITFRYSKRAKRMNAKINQGAVVVTLPYHFTEKTGMKFVESVRPKLREMKEKQLSNFSLRPNKELETLNFKIKIEPHDRKDYYSKLDKDILTIYYPAECDVNDAKTQYFFFDCVKFFLRKDAKQYLPNRTYELAKRFEFTYSDVKIQSSTTRWGSCSGKKNINLTLYLMLLPMHLIDYVILHELCHTREMNHSSKFWGEMDAVTGNRSSELRHELKKYAIPKW